MPFLSGYVLLLRTQHLWPEGYLIREVVPLATAVALHYAYYNFVKINNGGRRREFRLDGA